MPIKRTANYDTANAMLTKINLELSQAGQQNLMSGHVHAEEIFAGILNLAFGYSLVNANRARHNVPGIDLIDESSKIAVQVTADWSSEKMKSTLASAAVQRLAKEGFTIKFCYIGEQKDCTKRRVPKNPHGIGFRAKDDVVLTTDILRAFAHKEIDVQDEIIGLLKKETGAGCLLTDALLKERLETAIADLGPRYTPEANVATPDMAAFDALATDMTFTREFDAHCRSLHASIERFSRLGFEDPIAGDAAKAAMTAIAPLKDSLAASRDPHNAIDWSMWASRVSKAAFECPTFPSCLCGEGDALKEAATKYGDIRHHHYELRALCSRTRTDLLENGSVLVVGEAGMGKSHLLADTAKRCLQLGGASILVLGQWFRDPHGSLDEIPRSLGFDCGLGEFLDEVSRYSSARNRPGFVFVDALNEGAGRAFWKNELIQLVRQMKARGNLRLVLSARTTYLNDVVPQSLENISRIECTGFENVEETAVEAFCDHYGIDYPYFPLLGEEFSNPLHLKLLCEHLSKNKANGFTSAVSLADVIESHLAGINDRLSTVLKYDPHVNLVGEVVRALIESADFSYGSVDYSRAIRISKHVAEPFVAQPGNFLSHLVYEGLFNVFGGRGDECLVFSYELVGNVAIALRVTHLAAEQVGQHCGAIDEKEALAHILNTSYSWAVEDWGIMAALSAIAPERLGVELYKAIPVNARYDDVIAMSFVNGVGWRAGIDLTPELEDFIEHKILGNEDALQTMVDKAFQLAARTGFEPLCEYLRSAFLSVDMSLRDYAWSSRIARGRSALRLADWAWSHSGKMDPRSAEPVAQMLALALATVNLEQRITAVKALARILSGRPMLAHAVYHEYRKVDDDYILEGLHAALYGAIANADSGELAGWEDVARAVRDTVFDEEGAYPNVVVRDYSRLIVELVATSCGEKLDASASKPPYRSNWYGSLPAIGDIDAIIASISEEFGARSDEAIAAKTIVRSMTTEYGRGRCMYGDYGRYVFGYAVGDWHNQFDEQDLSNVVTSTILKEWWKPELHARFDKMTRWYEGRFAPGCERVGKKYQKIGTHRLIARLLDNYPPYKTEFDYRDGYWEALKLNAERRWQAIEAGRFDDVGEPISEKDWRIGERNIPFGENQIGRIVLAQRTMDPTVLWRKDECASETPLFADILDACSDSTTWVESDEQRQALDDYHLFQLNGNSMYLLAARKHWKLSIDGLRRREASWTVGARFIASDSAFNLSNENSEFQRGNGPTDHYSDVFLGELYSGYGYETMECLYSEEQEAEDAVSRAAVYEHYWDDERSEAEPRFIFAPAKELVDYLGLYRHGAGDWLNAKGDVIATAIFDADGECEALMFDAAILDDYLAETNLELYWDEYLEKQTRTKLYRCWQFARPEKGIVRTRVSDQYVADKDARRALYVDDWID